MKIGILVDRRLKMRLVSMEMGILVDRRFKIKVVSMKRAVFVDKGWCSLRYKLQYLKEHRYALHVCISP